MARKIKTQDDYYLASQWQLMLRKLRKKAKESGK